MKVLAILTAAAMGGAPQSADTIVRLTEQQAADCEQGGGCLVITEESLNHLKVNVFMQGYVVGAQTCGKSI